MKTERSVSDILYIVLVLALCALIVAVFALTFLGSGERSFFYPVLLLFALLLNILPYFHHVGYDLRNDVLGLPVLDDGIDFGEKSVGRIDVVIISSRSF